MRNVVKPNLPTNERGRKMEKLRSISIGRARAGSMFTVRGVNGEELGYSDRKIGESDVYFERMLAC